MTWCETVRLLLATASLENWEIQGLDEEIHMMQPEGFITKGQGDKVYRLKKAIYGLKQASLAWNKQAHEGLIKLDYIQILRCI